MRAGGANVRVLQSAPCSVAILVDRVLGGAVQQKKDKGREEEESGRGKNVISPLFSLLNRLQPVRGVLWPNFTEPECLLAKCSKVGVRQQRTITLDVQQTIIP